MFTASPVANRSAVPVTTSPVLTPILALRPNSGRALRISTAARQARQRVVLMKLRDTEDGHDCITDELLDRAAVMLDYRFHPLEVAREGGTKRLWIDRLAERGRAGDVAEEDRDRFSML